MSYDQKWHSDTFKVQTQKDFMERLILRKAPVFTLSLVLAVALIISAIVSVDVKASTEDVVILSSSYYVSSGYSYVVGEVQNQGTNNLEFVRITATFYDSADNVLATGFTYTDIDILVPQQKSPFEVSSFPSESLPVDHYSVVVSSYSATSKVPYGDQNLNVQGVTTSIEYGYYHVRGEVANTGMRNATFVKVVMTFYDSDGTVIGKAFTYTDPYDIEAGSKAPFDGSTFPQEIVPANYLVQVQCSETLLASSISCSVSSTSLPINSNLTISGSITPARPGVTVTISYKGAKPWTVLANVTTSSDGSFSYWCTSAEVGSYQFKASWEGDSTYSGATSNVISVTFTKISTNLSCSVSPSKVTEGSSITVSGSINPALSSKTITLTYKKPDDSTFTKTVTTGSDGSYSDSYKPDATGSWSVTASWDGDATHEAASSSSKSFTVKKKGLCLIATATYESEMSPEVQFLREFRDNKVLNTFAGSNFMTVFDRFYYSFSPTVASTISSNKVLKEVMKVILYSLIGILHLSSATFALFSFSPELGVVMAGLVASSLIGVVYFMPWILLLSFLKKFQPSTRVIRLTGLVWAGSVIAIALAEAVMFSPLMMISTGAFVLATICLATLAMVRAITKRCIP